MERAAIQLIGALLALVIVAFVAGLLLRMSAGITEQLAPGLSVRLIADGQRR